MDNYINDRDSKYLSKLNKLQKEILPDFCKDFFVGIAMKTTVLTRYNYATDLKTFFQFCTLEGNVFENIDTKDLLLSDLTLIQARDIEQFLYYIDNYQNDKNTIIRNNDKAKARKLCSIRALFRYFCKKELLKNNVTLTVDMPKIRKKNIVRLEDHEVNKVFATLDNDFAFDDTKKNTYNRNNTQLRDKAIISLLLNTGIRVSELVGINCNDIDFKSNSFIVTRKGGKKETIYFSNEIADLLLEYEEYRNNRLEKAKIFDQDSFFISLQNKRIGVRSVEILVKKYTELVTPLKTITPHKLRSTFGTSLYRATNDIYLVSVALGHSDMNTTKNYYADISTEMLKDAAKQFSYNKPDQNSDN